MKLSRSAGKKGKKGKREKTELELRTFGQTEARAKRDESLIDRSWQSSTLTQAHKVRPFKVCV